MFAANRTTSAAVQTTWWTSGIPPAVMARLVKAMVEMNSSIKASFAAAIPTNKPSQEMCSSSGPVSAVMTRNTRSEDSHQEK